jgi:hypothetical protein
MTKLVTITAEKAHDVLSRAKAGERFECLPFQRLSAAGRQMRADIEARQMRGELPKAPFIPPKDAYEWRWIPCRSH